MPYSRSRTVLPFAFFLVLLSAVPSAAQTAWSTTMTVGVAPGGGIRGYSEHFDYGALADDNFTLNGVSYTVTNLYYDDLDGSYFGLSLSSSFAHDGWTLHVGDHVFHFDDATSKNFEFDNFPGYFFFWDPGAFDGWTVGEEVSVSLVGPRSVPALPLPALGLLLVLLIAVRKYAGKTVHQLTK
ncbi:MAG: hypothetical protein OXF93_15275 [Acidobacteria bacterium]|nr:hypothetical protein [Acidobacteriota bacterium]